MRAISLVACSVLIAACSSNKPAKQPSRPEARSESSYTVSTAGEGSSESQRSSSAEPATPPAENAAEEQRADDTEGSAVSPRRSNAMSTMRKPAPPPPGPAAAGARATQPDDTKVNERDENRGSVTPTDQGNDEKDLEITQEIRKAVMADGSLSFTAKNVKIITIGGKVTLRGPVKTEAEHSAIAAAARRIAGAENVSDQIEVKAK